MMIKQSKIEIKVVNRYFTTDMKEFKTEAEAREWQTKLDAMDALADFFGRAEVDLLFRIEGKDDERAAQEIVEEKFSKVVELYKGLRDALAEKEVKKKF